MEMTPGLSPMPGPRPATAAVQGGACSSGSPPAAAAAAGGKSKSQERISIANII